MIPGETRRREPSMWIFSRELKETTFVEESTDERVRPFVITPLGTRVKRILFVGNITSISSEESNTKAVISDAVGSFYVNASNREFSILQKEKLDSYSQGNLVTVMGRVSSLRTEQGGLYFTIFPEKIYEADENTRLFWTIMTSSSAERKIMAIKEASKLEKPEALSLVKLGYTREEAECALRSVKHYPGADLAPLIDAISGSTASARVSETVNNAKEQLLAVIRTSEDPKGCRYEDILSAMEGQGVERQTVDEALNLLGTEGEVYEVSLKRFRAI
ncbi:MAG: hypothetical protein M1148_02920 [Candidatus Thermoplasmatota archaeon]|nr:hypothetical protein [Candidatus Thermoplasmatota archaeon]